MKESNFREKAEAKKISFGYTGPFMSSAVDVLLALQQISGDIYFCAFIRDKSISFH